MIHVLLIEDNPDDVEVVKRLLVDSDFDVSNSSTIAAALKTLSVVEPDVVLLDLHLPNGEGLELVKRILGRAGTTPVVVLTGGDDELLAQQCISEGVMGFVSKENLNRINLLTAMHLAVQLKSVKRGSETLNLLKEKLEATKTKVDEVVQIMTSQEVKK